MLYEVITVPNDPEAAKRDSVGLLAEDIVDTGLTARYLLQTLAGRGPNSLTICTLLDRTSRRLVQVPVELNGGNCPN